MIEFDAVDGGLAVTDEIEETHYRLETGAVAPASVGVDALPTPVDAAVEVTCDRVRLPTVVVCYLRDLDGDLRHPVEGERAEVPEAAVLETTTAPMKLYLRFTGPATVESTGQDTVVRFDDPRSVVVGARSSHRQPAATVAVPESPSGLARAVSAFGASLKTTSAERSFPTLRGHPPLVEFDADPDLGGLAPPATDLRLEVPDDYGSVFTVAPLAYYLGAEVETGADTPRLVAAGESFPLSGDLRTATADALQHCFLLDCITRTEGFYPVELHERSVAAERTAIAPSRWYDLPLAERTVEYLSVPRDAVDDLLDWHLTADVEPVARNAEILPFVVNDLAVVRSPSPVSRAESPVTEPQQLTEFFRDDEGDAHRGPGVTREGRPTRTTQNAESFDEEVISPVDVDTYGHIWVGQRFPMGSAKPTVDAYRRRLRKQPGDGSTTSITLVCNDEEMLGETDEDLYGFFDMLTFDVESHYDLRTGELREVLAGDTDFLHYVGHVEDEGLQCRDGHLDLRTLARTGVDAFLLNGCRSYEQGQALVDAGAYGGVVTLTTVGNTKATKTGRHLAHLLDIGFDFYGALDVVRRIQISRQNYVVVGDGSITISQSDSGAPYLLDVTELGPDEIEFSYLVYPAARFGLGSMTLPYVDDTGTQFLACGRLQDYSLTYEEFDEELGDERVPMMADRKLFWTNQVDPADLRDRR